MQNQTNIINHFIDLLETLNQIKNINFSGIGLVLYEDWNKIKPYCSNLADELSQALPMKLGSQALRDFLTNISSYKHPLHDGFHFINKDGFLTHVAQFFSPPIDRRIINVHGKGARTLCSLYGSKLETILMIGTVSSKNEVYLFKNGDACMMSAATLQTN